MIIGYFENKLNDKGRTALPAKFRHELGTEIIVAKWYEGCIVLIGSKSWLGLIGKLSGESKIVTSSVRDTDRFIMGSAFEIILDDQGRFVIPKSLRDYANIGGEIIFLGLGDRVEIWDKKRWSEREKYVAEHAAEIIENIAQERLLNDK